MKPQKSTSTPEAKEVAEASKTEDYLVLVMHDVGHFAQSEDMFGVKPRSQTRHLVLTSEP